MCLAIKKRWWSPEKGRHYGEDTCWLEDSDKDKIENHLRKIAIEIIVTGEIFYRDNVIHQYEKLIKEREEIRAKIIKREAEAERKKREAEAKRERENIEHLLKEANALHQAQQIRDYVETVKQANANLPVSVSKEELNKWILWALEQADRIDPVASKRFIAATLIT